MVWTAERKRQQRAAKAIAKGGVKKGILKRALRNFPPPEPSDSEADDWPARNRRRARQDIIRGNTNEFVEHYVEAMSSGPHVLDAASSTSLPAKDACQAPEEEVEEDDEDDTEE